MESRQSQTGSSMTSFSLVDRPPAKISPDLATARGRASDRLQLQFSADADGRTFLSRQYVAYPFHICRALYSDASSPELATVTIQSCSGGLYEEDRLDMEVEARAGAAAHLTTQAATVVHSMPSGSAVQSTRIRAEPRSYLEYLPDPLILFPQSSLVSTINLRVSAGAVVLVSDSFLMHDPIGAGRAFATYMSEIQIEDETGRLLAIDRMAIDGATYSSRYPGVMNDFGAQGTMIAAGTCAIPECIAGLDRIGADRGVAIGVSRLPNSAGIIVRILASDGAALRREMHYVWSAFRRALKGGEPAPQRK